MRITIIRLWLLFLAGVVVFGGILLSIESYILSTYPPTQPVCERNSTNFTYETNCTVTALYNLSNVANALNLGKT